MQLAQPQHASITARRLLLGLGRLDKGLAPMRCLLPVIASLERNQVVRDTFTRQPNSQPPRELAKQIGRIL
jgi:hypothetical protein